MRKTALISGCSGQDGSYLAERLLSLGYQVVGMVRRSSVCENQTSRIQHLLDRLILRYGDVTDSLSCDRVVQEFGFHEVYHLAAMSQVRISFDVPQYTAQTNAIGVLNMLEAVRRYAPDAHFYMSSSSEMFGSSVDEDNYQRETTPMHPTSPYGCAKLFGYSITRHYRRAYDMFAANGILFNHSSPRRGANFVEQKVVRGAVAISQGKQDKLVLGNMDAKRDFGHSRDYVKAMHMILNHEEPDDFVIATGETRSVRDVCEMVFSLLGMDYRKYVHTDTEYMRPQELPYLRGDSHKARFVLGWEPTVTFEEMIKEMVEVAQNAN
jgi:GDPmannose 4,6-dehydratase